MSNLRMNPKTYSELIKLKTYEERLKYLSLNCNPGEETFGFDRYINQEYYKSKEWDTIRTAVILRDNACDLGIEGREIISRILIHHMNPITIEDINNNTEYLKNPEFLISTSYGTHNAIHYGKPGTAEPKPVAQRSENDQRLWKKTIF